MSSVSRAELSLRLEEYFKPLNIAAYTNCCRMGCTGTYADELDFKVRRLGICFIRLYLDGINYDPHPKGCYADYGDFEYLTKYWNEETELLEKWCSLIGLKIGEYTICKPSCEQEAVKIEFKEALNLSTHV